MVTDAGGTRVIVAVADVVELAMLVAVIMTFWVALMLDGAVYIPLAESVPILGFILHATPELLVPVTLAENCWAWEADILAELGLIVTDTGGTRVIMALANLVESATLVAVIVTV